VAESVNTQIADKLLERQLKILRLETRLRRDVWGILVRLEQDILFLLKDADPSEIVLLRRRREAIEALMQDIGPLIDDRYDDIAGLLTTAFIRLASSEAKTVQEIINNAADDNPIENIPSERVLRAGVTQSLFPSPATPTDFTTTGEDWWQRAGASLTQRIGDQLMVSAALGESLVEMTRRIRGSSDNGFTDGVMAKARDDAARLVRTQLTNTVAESRMAVADHNPQSTLVAIHQSILDSKTSNVCLSRHGLQYTIPDHEPIGHSIPYLTGPPYHVNCRSSMVVGVRGGGALMEANLSAWLRRKGPAFQDALLGPTRAKMYRAGDLSPRQLIDSATGKPLTLEELGA